MESIKGQEKLGMNIYCGFVFHLENYRFCLYKLLDLANKFALFSCLKTYDSQAYSPSEDAVNIPG